MYKRKYNRTLLGILLGALGGYLYYHYVGCASGTCAITSKPINSTVYGAVMGILLTNLLSSNSTINNKTK
ncbi:MAG: hypothetical protein RIQ62_551 [Bacteroidota bacterium]|jgi:hypothetical protein